MFKQINKIVSLTRDLVKKPDAHQILLGTQLFHPFKKYQITWLNHFYPNDVISTNNTWYYLQKYVMPLIKKHASFYHVEGIKRLQLDFPTQPLFSEFQKTFSKEANGFQIVSVEDEIPPRDYFKFIRNGKFPCIENIRSQRALFCAAEPDFWHEAIGHIAPLIFPEVQSFYQQMADYILSAKSEKIFEQRIAVAWTLTEYGFLMQGPRQVMFGAALVGSHLAHMRYINNLISIEPANLSAIIDSKFYNEDAAIAKTSKGKFRFFCMPNLNFIF